MMATMPQAEVRAGDVSEELKAEREARREAARALRRERAAHRRTTEQLERTRGNVVVLERQLQLMAARLEATEAQLAWKSRPVWRRLFRRAPRA
jgi:hypothetical protein